ncbi:L,D-transpeptidase family protein [Bradyrhizobium sp. ISRA443]|uniref:L,D-transpeptidase family protein n=1 Tax=unclassified Bradyrhizobium TaxID=2631580 RepID=UPI00247A219C|nr:MULTISPECIES: L,D-transpeptidase family protein [unclassified Bradyrhizobium]WGS01323.1 L,D-transpeptidase family protein [Bradyrhizobium sp. ISRA436]WGS08210.1 L,D-transpeptidase family protein [Bradyrhizobium sp. ISRA437]WGS15098.1 L,D-transpeptidase family protein [Bradyrhizobium sp. ISRA443]
MQRVTLVAMATMLAALPAVAQTASAPGPAAAVPPRHTAPAAATATTPSNKAKPAASTSAAETRSAAALALSREPTYDPGSAQRIREALTAYSDLAARGGWPTIPADAKFALGVPGANDDLLRKRLIITGDLAADRASGAFDEVTAEAVKRFQTRHGLAATGTVTPRTLAALNVPVQKRIKQIEASLERLAQMDFQFGQRYVVVNIPATFAEAVEDDKVVRRYRVIVGKTEKPSPTLTSEITDIILNPTWTVPSSITKTEIAAHMRKDPTYLSRMHMDVLDAHDNQIDPRSVDWSAPNVTVRQQSGTWNALGAVKIDMPNSYSVYMHDTNQRSLFSDDYRFDSHGCSRVDNVRDLAAWLLRDQPQWTRAAIDAAIATGQRQDIRMLKKVPVAWIYLTAWMTKDRTIQFRNDVYDQDQQLLEATAEEAAFFNKAAEHPLAAHLAQ